MLAQDSARTPLPDSMWARTAAPAMPSPPLIGDLDADVAIVGAGYWGLSAALHAAERGARVVVLLDEPSLGLAPKIVRQIFDLITEIRATGTAILLVEQNVKAALKVADHGYVMEGGRVALEDPAEALRADERIRATYLGRD